jgi:hypothetical protein
MDEEIMEVVTSIFSEEVINPLIIEKLNSIKLPEYIDRNKFIKVFRRRFFENLTDADEEGLITNEDEIMELFRNEISEITKKIFN